MTWNETERDSFKHDEMTIATYRPDGTLRDGVIIWMASVDGDIFIRAVKGPDGPWFRGATSTHRAQVTIGNYTREVSLVQADPALTTAIDNAYQTKYRRFSPNIVNSVLTPQAKAATLRLVPDTGE